MYLQLTVALGAGTGEPLTCAAGLALTGFALTGFALTGFALTGFALTGFALTGFALTGFALTGLALTLCVLEAVDPLELHAATSITLPTSRAATALLAGLETVRRQAGVAVDRFLIAS